MIGFIIFALAFAAMFALAIRREPLWAWAIWFAGVALGWTSAFWAANLHGPSLSAVDLIAFVPAIVFGLLSWRPIVGRAVVAYQNAAPLRHVGESPGDRVLVPAVLLMIVSCVPAVGANCRLGAR